MGLERERVALAGGALGVEVQELGRRVVRLLRGFLLRLLPLAAAELVQRRRVRRGAAVAADEVQVADRDVELGVVGVDELQELVRAVAEVEREQAEVTADAVLLVHDRIADAHLGEVAHHRVDVAALRGFARGTAHDARIKLALGDERDRAFRPLEARPDRRGDEQHALGRCEHAGEPFDEMRVEVVFREVLLHRLAASRALRRDRDLVRRGRDVALERRQAGRRRGDPLARAAARASDRRRLSAISTRAKVLIVPLNASGARNSSVGGSNGRALSPRSSR